MSKPDFNAPALLSTLSHRLVILKRYAFVAFVLVVAAIYGFILYRIQTLSSAQPAPGAVTSQVTAANVPNIDPSLIKQLQSLQDNSVSIKTLFNQARSNPFQDQ